MKKISIVLALLIGSYLNVNAAIQYTDVTPNATYTTTANFMINSNDGVQIDASWSPISFQAHKIMGSTMKCAASGGTNMIVYNLNDDIGTAGTYFSQLSDLSKATISNYYIGFEITIGGKKHYGWMKLSSSNNSVTIHEYAYEDVPNTIIKAGDKGITSVNNLTNTIDFNVFPNPNTGIFTINVNTLDEATLLITNAIGEVIVSKVLFNTKESFSLKGHDKGIYFLSITSGNDTKTTKLLIQ